MLDLKSFVVDQELIIDKPHWYQLKNSYTQQELKDAISDAIDGLPLPLYPITKEEAKEDFNELVKFNARKLLNKDSLYAKAEYKYELSNWYMTNSLVGRKSSNYFHQFARWKTQHVKHPSPYRSWTEKKLHQTFLNPLWSMNFKEINSHVLRECITLRMYLASQYPPAVAKCIYELFEAKNVLDFSMGWGDRLAGFHASKAETYLGIDPNWEVMKNYPLQDDLYNTGKEARFIHAVAEEIDLGIWKRKFDMVFTSPPYFHVERYCKDENQSWMRYGKNIDDWLEGFLYPTLNYSWEALEDGGTMIINIADVYSGDNQYVQICDPMNDFISNLSDAHYSGCFGLKLSKRPQSNNDREESKYKKIIEPMWVWKKGDDRSLEQIIDDSSPLNKFFVGV